MENKEDKKISTEEIKKKNKSLISTWKNANPIDLFTPIRHSDTVFGFWQGVFQNILLAKSPMSGYNKTNSTMHQGKKGRFKRTESR